MPRVFLELVGVKAGENGSCLGSFRVLMVSFATFAQFLPPRKTIIVLALGHRTERLHFDDFSPLLAVSLPRPGGVLRVKTPEIRQGRL